MQPAAKGRGLLRRPRPRTDATAPSRPFGSHPTGWSRRHRRQPGRDFRPGLPAAGSEVGQGELPRRNGLRQGLQQQDALQPAAVHRQRSRAVDLPSPAAQIPTQRKKPTHMDARLGLKHKRGVYINKWEQPSYPSDGCSFALKEKYSNIRWAITVQQDSSDTVTTELPVTLNCNKESLKKSEPITKECCPIGWSSGSPGRASRPDRGERT